MSAFPDTRDYKTSVDLNDLETGEQHFCKQRDEFGCRREFVDVFLLLMSEHSLTMPRDAEEAKCLYITLDSLMQDLV